MEVEVPSHRDRVLKAIGHQEPDRVPVDYWAAPEVTERLCSELGLGDGEGLLRQLDIDLRYVEGPSLVGQELRRFDGGVVEDLWGVRRRVVEVRTPTGRWRYKHLVESPLAGASCVADIEGHEGWPSADWWDYSSIAEQCEQHAGFAVVLKGDRLDRCSQLKTMMYLRGPGQVLIDMATNPGLVEAMLERIRAYYLDYNERVFRQVEGKADIFMMGDDFGTQTGPMMSRRMWRRYFSKGFKEYVDLAHRHGLAVMHHSCGSVRYLMEDFIEAGLDILQSIQPRAAGMDLADLERDYGGRIAFHGSMDIQQTLPGGSPEEVDEEVRRRMSAAMAGGGFILGTAHNILPDVPTENILAMYEACRRYGRY